MQKKQRIKKIIKTLGLILLSFIVIGIIYEQIAEFTDKTYLKAPGQLVQVGDHKMHIYCTGENIDNKPTVVLESGGMNSWATWSNVQPEISKHTKVCSYDRSGYGFSEGAHDQRTNVEVVQELEQLLKNANITGPYILAGHSIGGYYIRVFADRNPDKVTGLVFIDSSHEDQGNVYEQNTNSFADKLKTNIQKAVTYSAIKVGVLRLATTINPEYFGLPAENLRINRALMFSQLFGTANRSDDFAGAFESTDQVAAVNNLADIPIRILTHKTETAGYKFKRHQDLAKLSTDSKLITVANANHYIQVTQPQIVIDQILELVINSNK